MILKLIHLFKKRSSSILEIKNKINQIFTQKSYFNDNEVEILNSLKKKIFYN